MRSGGPVSTSEGATSSRSQLAICSAMVQRNVAGGVTATLVWSGSKTAWSCTASGAPQSPGPINVPSAVKTASFARRSWQAEGDDGAVAAAPSSGNDA